MVVASIIFKNLARMKKKIKMNKMDIIKMKRFKLKLEGI